MKIFRLFTFLVFVHLDSPKITTESAKDACSPMLQLLTHSSTRVREMSRGGREEATASVVWTFGNDFNIFLISFSSSSSSCCSPPSIFIFTIYSRHLLYSIFIVPRAYGVSSTHTITMSSQVAFESIRLSSRANSLLFSTRNNVEEIRAFIAVNLHKFKRSFSMNRLCTTLNRRESLEIAMNAKKILFMNSTSCGQEIEESSIEFLSTWNACRRWFISQKMMKTLSWSS